MKQVFRLEDFERKKVICQLQMEWKEAKLFIAQCEGKSQRISEHFIEYPLNMTFDCNIKAICLCGEGSKVDVIATGATRVLFPILMRNDKSIYESSYLGVRLFRVSLRNLVKFFIRVNGLLRIASILVMNFQCKWS